MFNRTEYVKYYDKIDGTMLLPSEALANCRYRLVPVGDSWLVSEVMVCSLPKFNRNHYGLLNPVHRSVRDYDADPMTPEEKAQSLDRSRRRARRAVRDIMDCNDFEYFMTFTLDGDKADRTDYAAFIKAVNTYLDNRVRRYGWKYCAVVEYHKKEESNGEHALHLHACVAGTRYNLADSGTVLRPDKKRPVMRSTAYKQGYRDSDLRTVYNVTDWTLGFSTAIRITGRRSALSRYISKYITKSDEKIGGRWYYSGGQLERPLMIYDDVDFSGAPADVEFSSDFGDYKIKYYDEGIALDCMDTIFK